MPLFLNRHCDRPLGGAPWGARGAHGVLPVRASRLRPGLPRSHRRVVLPLINFIPYSLTSQVPLFLKRQCDRTLRPGRPRLRLARRAPRPRRARRRLLVRARPPPPGAGAGGGAEQRAAGGGAEASQPCGGGEGGGRACGGARGGRGAAGGAAGGVQGGAQGGGGGREAGVSGASEKDAKLAQKLGQPQPFMAVFSLECTGQLASFGPT